MPYIYGKIYPEIDSAGLLSHRFGVLIDLREDDKLEFFLPFILQLNTLKVYLDDIVDSLAHLELFIPPISNPNLLNICKNLGLNLTKTDKGTANYNEKIKSIVKSFDLDLVATEDKELIDFFKKEKDLNFLVEDYNGAKKNIEIFVRGQEIPWSFSRPCWYAPWTTFYTLNDEFALKGYKIYGNKFTKLGLNEKTLEIVRSLLLNRITDICYTRDKLLFYVQQRNFAKRHEWQRQNFSFEACYYLCYYYLLIWGGVDQLSRILNNSLNLGFTHFSKISIAQEKFVAKIISADEKLGNLYKDEKFLNWIKQLRRSRHFTAHQGSILLSPIMQPPEKEPSDVELEKEAQSKKEWNLMKRTMPPEAFEWYKASVKQEIKLSKYKLIADDVMVMQDDGEKLIFRPLKNIEWDFNNFKSITLDTFQRLYELLSRE